MTSARHEAPSTGRMMTSGADFSSGSTDPAMGQPLDAAARQDAVYNRMLMATVAGRRTMVVTDCTGDNGARLGRRMAEYMTSLGGMSLTATGYRDAELEDLMAEAAAGLGLKRSGDLEDLALALERALDAAGSGLLVIFDAHLLSAPVIGELLQLSGSDTESGLYIQILLTGGPGLDVQFDKPGLANAARQIASSRWRVEGDAADTVVQPVDKPARLTLQAEPEPPPIMTPARPAGRERPAFTRRRMRRPDNAVALEPALEPRSLSKAPAVGVKSFDVRPEVPQRSGQSTRPSRRKYWILAVGILFAFAAGFITNALWSYAPKSMTEQLEGDGSSALTANLPNTAPLHRAPAGPEAQTEPAPNPLPSPPELPAAAALSPPEKAAPPAPPIPAHSPATASLPPEWKQPAERPRSSTTRNVSPRAQPPVTEPPVMADPIPLTPQPRQQAQLPPQETSRANGSSDVCLQGAGASKPPQDSLSGIAEGFMTDLRNLGRCLNSLTK
jgi:hypothetical protein